MDNEIPTPRANDAIKRAERCFNHSGAVQILAEIAIPLERELAAALAQNAEAKRVLKLHVNWHEAHDDYDGWNDSDLCEATQKVLKGQP